MKIKPVLVFLSVLLAVGAVSYAADWSLPPAAPPGCPTSNPACHPPINASANRQVKPGDLGVGAVVDSDFSADKAKLLVKNPASDIGAGGILGEAGGLNGVGVLGRGLFGVVGINNSAFGAAVAASQANPGGFGIFSFNPTPGGNGPKNYFQGPLGVGTEQIPAGSLIEAVGGDVCATPAGGQRRCLSVAAPTGGGTSTPATFLSLTDTPASYAGQSGKLVAVNSAASGLEFVAPPTGGGGGGGGTVSWINTGAGLTGGPITSSGTVSVDTAAISACTGSNQKIVWDGTNNRFTCGADQTSGGGGGAVNSVSAPPTEAIKVNPTTGNVSLSLGIAPFAGLSVDEVTGARLSLARYCATGQILKRTGQGWECAADQSGSGGGGGGTVISLSQGNGIALSPSPITTSGTVSVNMPYIINNLTLRDQCAPGAFMRGVGSGFPVCAAPTSPAVTATERSCQVNGPGSVTCAIGTHSFCALSGVPSGASLCKVFRDGSWKITASASGFGQYTCYAQCLDL